MNILIDGKILKGTVCPWKGQCSTAVSGQCNHEGEDHNVDYSCASARAFEITETKVDPDYISGLLHSIKLSGEKK